MQIKVGLIAFDVFEGGEFTFVKGLIDALKFDPHVHIHIFTSKNHSFAGPLHFNELKVSYAAEKNITINEVDSHNIRFGNGTQGSRKFLFNALPFVWRQTIKLPVEVDVLIIPYVHDQVISFISPDIPYIITPHDLRYLDIEIKGNFFDQIKSKIRNAIRKKIYQHAAKVVVDSKYVKNQLIDYYDTNPAKVEIIGYEGAVYRLQNLNISINDTDIREKFLLPEKFVFYPAHLIDAKNHINLIKSILFIQEKYNTIVPLILSGSYKEEGKDIIDLINAEASQLVKYVGFITEEELFNFYHAATALIYASKYDPTGIPIWEAFFCGTPVAASRILAIPEQVGNCGLLFDPNNIEEMAEQIYRLWTNQSLREDLSQKGKERIRGLTFENYSKKWGNVVRDSRNKNFN